MGKPKIRFKGYTEDWEQRKFGKIVEKYEDPVETPTDGYMRLGIRSHAKGTFHSYVEKGKELETAKMFRVAADKFIVNITFGWEHAVAITDENDAGKLVSHRFPQYSFNNGMVPKFFRYLILDENFKHHLELSSPGGAGRNRVLKLSDMLEYKMTFPSEAEQKKIAAYFDDLDNLITLHQRKCEETKNLKKYMLQKMFPQNGQPVPEIRFSGFTEDWEQRKLGDMGSTFTGLSGKTKEDFGHGDAQFITYMNVFSNPVANLEMTEAVEIDAKQNSVKKGDVFFTTSSETPEEVGMSCVMPENKDNIYLNSFCFGYRPTEKFDLDYLAYVLRADSFRKEMTFLAQGISRYNISKNKVMEVSIPVPDLEEQTMIGRYFSNLDHLITLHQRECDELQNIKKYMLQNMFV